MVTAEARLMDRVSDAIHATGEDVTLFDPDTWTFWTVRDMYANSDKTWQGIALDVRDQDGKPIHSRELYGYQDAGFDPANATQAFAFYLSIVLDLMDEYRHDKCELPLTRCIATGCAQCREAANQLHR